MRLPADGPRARIARLAAALTLAASLGACITSGEAPSFAESFGSLPVNGPQADYPVVVGEPYSIAGVEYAPEDVLNYDEVGFAAADGAGGAGVSGSHHTLPLPSYVEVTSLETGRTALVRLERRGPMSGHDLVALSPGALAQLEIASGSPVRVRRVNPPEDQRALLRAGQQAPLRIDTPMPLVEVLRRKLPGIATASAQAAMATAPGPARLTPPPDPARVSGPVPAQANRPPSGAPPLPPLDASGEAQATPVTASRPAQVANGFVVQAAAFSTQDRAASAASVLGGEVSRSGQYFRVRTGPFATRGEAEASLAKVRDAGYRDARIYTSG
jgi:rare lipoprotein A